MANERIMERNEIAAINAAMVTRFVPPAAEDVWHWTLYPTSGTTAAPILSLARYRFGAGSTQEFLSSMRPLICMGTLGMRLVYTKSVPKDPVEANSVLVLDLKDLTPETAALIADFRPDRLIGPPSFLLWVAEHIDRKTARGVADLHCVGETISSEMERAFLGHFPSATIRALYGAVEFGQISTPTCPYSPRNWYHPLAGITVEIHETDETGVGDILVTGTKNNAVRVERYRTGDIGRIKYGFCACGEYISFEVLGRRGHDFIKLAGAILRQEEFDRVAAHVGLFKEYRVEASSVVEKGGRKGKIVLHARRQGKSGTDAYERELTERFSRELFLTPTRTLANLVDDGIFVPLEIRYMDTSPSSGKSARLTLLPSSD